MYSYRRMAFLLLCITLLALLSACGDAQSNQSNSNKKATVTVLTWEGTDTNAAIDKALKDFMNQNPDITVQRLESPNSGYGDKLSSLVQAKKMPDLFWCGNDTEQQYTSQGLLYDYSSKLKSTKSADFDPSSFVPAAIQNWTTNDGKIGGLPTLMNTIGVWYNADAFQKAGLVLPKNGWTWDEMLSDAKKLTSKSGGTTNYGMIADNITSTSDGPFTMSVYSMSAGGQPFADKVNNPTKVTVDSQYTEGVSKVAAAIQSGSIAPPGYDSSNAASSFAAGKVPMLMSGQWLASGFLTNKPTMKYGFAPLPSQGTTANLYDAVGICTPSYTANADATWRVMQFLSTKAWETVLTGAPVAPPAYKPAAGPYYDTLKSGGLDSAASTVQYSLDSSSLASVRFTTTWASKANDIITSYWPDILQGKKPVSALQTMASQLNDLIKSS